MHMWGRSSGLTTALFAAPLRPCGLVSAVHLLCDQLSWLFERLHPAAPTHLHLPSPPAHVSRQAWLPRRTVWPDFLEATQKVVSRVSYPHDPLRSRMAKAGLPWDDALLTDLRWAAQRAGAALIRHALDSNDANAK